MILRISARWKFIELEFLIPVPQLCWRVGMFVGGEQGMGSR